MSKNTKPVELLEIGDLEANAVWEFVSGGETVVRPVRRLPVKSLTARLVGTQVRLSNGTAIWALIGNIDPNNPRLTEHFLTLSVLKSGKWFTLSRYHDFDYAEKGPESLASFFGLPVDEVFPISYDVSEQVSGDLAALSGTIPKEPKEKLTRSEIIAMAVP